MAKLEDMSKEEQRGIVLQFPRPPRCEERTKVTLLLPEHTARAYVMKVMDPKTGDVKRMYEVFGDPDGHLGGLCD